MQPLCTQTWPPVRSKCDMISQQVRLAGHTQKRVTSARTTCRWLGVDHVYLTENASSVPIKGDIQDFIDAGFVTYGTIKAPQAQMLVYYQCLQKYRHRYNWIAFFDADEIMVIREQCGSQVADL